MVCSIFCATANPAEVVIAMTEPGRGIIGNKLWICVSKGIENKENTEERKTLFRKFSDKR